LNKNMEKKDLCLEIVTKYNNFVKIEEAWRLEYEKALQKNKNAIRVAHSGMKDVCESFERVENLICCGYEKAKELMEEDFYGTEEFEMTVGFKTNVKIPKIEYTAAHLQEAKEHGEMLVLRIGQDNEGNPMTMKRILEIMAPRMPEGERLLYKQLHPGSAVIQSDSWYKDEPFFTQDSLKTEWVLIGKEFAPNTINNNLAHQTLELYNEMKRRGLLTKEEEKENIGLEKRLKELCEKMGVNWESQHVDNQEKCGKNRPEVSRELANLSINRKHRRSPVGILYDWAMRFKSRKGERGVLSGLMYDWSNTVTDPGSFVGLCDLNSDGGDVYRMRLDRIDISGAILFRGLPDR